MPGTLEWQPINGNFAVSTSNLVFKGGTIDLPDGRKMVTTGLAMTQQRFGGGRVCTNVKYSDERYAPSVMIVLFRDPQIDFRILAGLGGSDGMGAYQISTWAPQKGWTNVASFGISMPGLSKEHNLKIEVRGSKLDIYDNEVHMLRHDVPFALPESNIGIFVQSPSEVAIDNLSVDSVKKNVFVIMQFTAPYNELYTDVIKPVVTEAGFGVERADEISGPSLIIADICRKLREADLIIAEITPENPNVFYEVGFAHALGKPTILVAEQGRELPFDVSPFRTLFYENSIAGKRRIEEGLSRHINAIKRDYSAR
jgi:hypothetical protein